MRPPSYDDVAAALAKVATAQQTLVAKRMRADASTVHLFEAADKARAEAVSAHRTAVEAEGVERAGADLRQAEVDAERLLKEWGREIWAQVRSVAPSRPDEPLNDEPTVNGSLKRAGVA